jgi:hypothetical protein
MKTTLSLKKETLAELTPDELRFVNGGVDNSGSCTSCVCSCYAFSCFLWSVTDGLTQYTADYVAVNC